MFECTFEETALSTYESSLAAFLFVYLTYFHHRDTIVNYHIIQIDGCTGNGHLAVPLMQNTTCSGLMRSQVIAINAIANSRTSNNQCVCVCCEAMIYTCPSVQQHLFE